MLCYDSWLKKLNTQNYIANHFNSAVTTWNFPMSYVMNVYITI